MTHKMERLNVVTYVDDSKVEKYLSLGYNEVDEHGKTVKQGTPKSVEGLQVALSQAHEEIEKLQNENARLKSKVLELEAGTPATTRRKKA